MENRGDLRASLRAYERRELKCLQPRSEYCWWMITRSCGPLQQLLERTGGFEVVGHAGDGEEAERVAKEVVPDLVIMDVLMPGRDGIEACREIIDALPDVRVLMLTASTERKAVIEAVAAGADGYLQKFTGTEQLLATVRDVVRGEYRMPRDVMRRVFRRLRHMPEESDSPRRKALTSREKEILTQFAKGMSYSAIAESRGNRSSTVRNTIYGIQDKLGFDSKQEIVVWAVRNGLVD